ncbi:DUF6382 domain-containing protein [Gracilibacillus massiliensis]|uniref:DUF6382 domain-containing protein n=1 Tax=Gracilibacillus massiliensis TaxID=1564956 RepID=UPI00071CE1E3|nr:DUF6382 domain-containing protein [Gracilibacillus massiliensis]
MNETIYGLLCDFEQQQGHFMTISRQEPSPLQSDELANIQVKMMSANTIEKVLPLEVQEIDFNVKFYYDISSKRMLSQYVRERGLTMNELYELLYHISSAIESSKEYMLDEQHYVLHENFIFIGKDTKDVALTYLPLKDITQKPTLHAEFRELFFKLVGYVKALSGDGVQQLTSYLNGTDFQLKELMQKLDELRKTAVKEVTPKQPWEKKTQYAAPTNQNNQASNPQPEPVKKPVQSTPKPSQPEAKKATPKKQEKQKKQEAPTEVAKEQEKKGPSPIIVFCVGVLGLAVIWKMYQSFPTEGMLYISAGLSIAVFAGIYYFLAVFGKNTRNKSTLDETNQDKTPKKQKQQKKNQGISPKQVDDSQSHSYEEQLKPALANSENYFQNLHQETTLLSQSNSTVALDENVEGGAYLEVDRNGQSEKIQLHSDSFIIGRNQSTVQYFEDTAGISRTHIEIIKNGETYMVKDLGSKNGSKLNDQPMVAYKTYPLNEGDRVRLAKITYTFHKG